MTAQFEFGARVEWQPREDKWVPSTVVAFVGLEDVVIRLDGNDQQLRVSPNHLRRMDGASLIAAERRRQVAVEDWTAAHDDKYTSGSLARAAACYALPPTGRPSDYDTPAEWPWDSRYWKPSPDDRVKELVKAGALIAAEIDRLQRTQGGA